MWFSCCVPHEHSGNVKQLTEGPSLSSHHKNVQVENHQHVCFCLLTLPSDFMLPGPTDKICRMLWLLIHSSLGCYRWALQNCPFLCSVLVAVLKHPERDIRLKIITPLQASCHKVLDLKYNWNFTWKLEYYPTILKLKLELKRLRSGSSFNS